jgi:hypothetical protein
MLDMSNFLLEQAARCRRLAQTISDRDFAEKLLIMAHGYEVKASNVQSPPTVPSGVPDMTNPTQKEIERRAYQLWERAGQPKGKDQEFYFEAERQLKEERVRHELKTPDNL